jgi:hypothetical protein
MRSPVSFIAAVLGRYTNSEHDLIYKFGITTSNCSHGRTSRSRGHLAPHTDGNPDHVVTLYHIRTGIQITWSPCATFGRESRSRGYLVPHMTKIHVTWLLGTGTVSLKQLTTVSFLLAHHLWLSSHLIYCVFIYAAESVV